MYDLTNEENNITTVCVLRLTKVGNKPLYVLAASSFWHHRPSCHLALGSTPTLAEPRLLNEKLNIIVDILGGVIAPMLHGRRHLQAILQ